MHQKNFMPLGWFMKVYGLCRCSFKGFSVPWDQLIIKVNLHAKGYNTLGP